MQPKDVDKKITIKYADTINQVPTVIEVHLNNSVWLENLVQMSGDNITMLLR